MGNEVETKLKPIEGLGLQMWLCTYDLPHWDDTLGIVTFQYSTDSPSLGLISQGLNSHHKKYIKSIMK